MATRTAEAVWEGNLREGSGTVKLGSGAYEGPYSFRSRFEDGSGTNPEELIGAAHAGCFSMALSAGLTKAGYTARRIHTTARVSLEKVGESFKITREELSGLGGPRRDGDPPPRPPRRRGRARRRALIARRSGTDVTMASGSLTPFRNQKYLNLETFRRDGRGVKTPVWFVLRETGAFYVYTEAGSWKVKRIRNDPHVRIAPCDMRGNVTGEWQAATAKLVSGDEEQAANRLLDQKYFLKKVFNLLTKLKRHARVMIKIELTG
jgi:OsmC subfamily peroxiredoxin/PPOX class probable F420-dependent enzyme